MWPPPAAVMSPLATNPNPTAAVSLRSPPESAAAVDADRPPPYPLGPPIHVSHQQRARAWFSGSGRLSGKSSVSPSASASMLDGPDGGAQSFVQMRCSIITLV